MTAYRKEITVRFRDTDMLGHVNSAVYVSYLELARASWYYEEIGDIEFKKFPFIVARVEIDYRKPILITSKPVIDMWVSDIGKSSWTFSYRIFDKHSNAEYALGKTVLVHYDYKNNKSIPLSDETLKILNKLKP